MVGTGPYRHVDYRQGERLELARNTEWYGPVEPWDRVVYRYHPAGRLPHRGAAGRARST